MTMNGAGRGRQALLVQSRFWYIRGIRNLNSYNFHKGASIKYVRIEGEGEGVPKAYAVSEVA